MRIVFMGTPEFAVECLDRLHQSQHEIIAVITAVDKPAGRGRQLRMSPVKQYALQNEIPVLQPKNLKNLDFLDTLRIYRADLQVVVAFRMLPVAVWDMPPKGTVNLHASLLPDYRGAAPINWAIMNGETQTGITTFFIEHQIDTGDLLKQEPIEIGADMTAGELHDIMMVKGADLVLETVNGIESGDIAGIPQQPGSENKHAPKIHKEDCRIDWSQPIARIKNHIRGLNPYPGAFTILNGKTLKVYGAAAHKEEHAQPCGFIDSDQKTYLHYYGPDGYVAITDLKLEGKRRMSVEDFLRGYSWD